MTLEQIIDIFRARRSGAGYKALCPSHEDKNPSLSINERDGKILFHCQAGCETKDVLAAKGLTFADLKGAAPNEGKVSPKEVATYDYTDETGTVLYQVVRYHPKDFRQRTPDGKGGWDWKLNGVQRVPYFLHGLKSAERVIVCEGEKDVETCWAKLGLPATCNSGGAGKWRDEHSEFLRGKHVVIVADADEPGRKHAQQVAISLHLRAASIKLIEMPDAKDLTVWVEKGGSAAEFAALTDGSPVWSPDAAQDPPKSGGWRSAFHRICELSSGEPEAIIEGYYEEGFSFLGAKAGVAKTWLAISEGQALRTGKPFLGVFPVPRQRNVVYLIPEMTERRFRTRCEKLGVDIEDPGFVVRTMSDGAPLPLNDPLLRECVEELRPVIYLDTAIRFNSGREENSAGEVSAGLINSVYELIKLGAPAVRALHHRAKDASDDELTLENVLRGTGDFGASAVCVWGAAHVTALRAGKLEELGSRGKNRNGDAREKLKREYLKESKELGRCYLECVKSGDRDLLMREFQIQLRPSINETGQIELLTSPPLPLPDIGELFTSNPAMSADELAKTLGVSKATAWRRAQAQGWHFDQTSELWKRP